MESPLIVSASRRTDIAAFHSRWFRRRLDEGFCHVMQPYTGRVARVSLSPDDVCAFVFWTRDPIPLLPEMEALQKRGVGVLVHVTITGYGPPVESHGPPLSTALRNFERLAARLGPDASLWRYDPIVLSEELPAPAHRVRFETLAAALEGMTHRCTFSFVDFYGKTTRNLAKIEAIAGKPFHRPDLDERKELAHDLAQIAARHSIQLLSCCEDALVEGDVGKSRCIDPQAIAQVMDRPLENAAFKPTRQDCGCAQSVDIGAYDTCAFGCAYCYATSSRDTALRRIRAADANDSILFRPPSLAGVDLDSRVN
jgi:hypothetical protein